MLSAEVLSEEHESTLDDSDVFLRRNDAAAYLKERFNFCSVGLLAKYATTGNGPVYYKIGRLTFYRRADLDAWIKSRLSRPMRSTSNVVA